MTDILNCPCCNGKAKFVPHSKLIFTFMTRIGRVCCKKCGLSTATGYKAIVIRWWNRRVERGCANDTREGM